MVRLHIHCWVCTLGGDTCDRWILHESESVNKQTSGIVYLCVSGYVCMCLLVKPTLTASDSSTKGTSLPTAMTTTASIDIVNTTSTDISDIIIASTINYWN